MKIVKKKLCGNCWWHSNEFYEQKQLKCWCDLFGRLENAKVDVSDICEHWCKDKPELYNTKNVYV